MSGSDGAGVRTRAGGVEVDAGEPIASARAAISAAAIAQARPASCKDDGLWTVTRQAVFFDHLAATGDVPAAAEAAGVTPRDAYSKLRRNARFAERWRRAVDVGYERLETTLLRRAIGEPGATLDIATALLLLDRRAGSAAAPAKGGGARDARAKAERELLRRLQAIGKRGDAAARA